MVVLKNILLYKVATWTETIYLSWESMKRKRGVTVQSTLEFRFLFTIRHESTPME